MVGHLIIINDNDHNTATFVISLVRSGGLVCKGGWLVMIGVIPEGLLREGGERTVHDPVRWGRGLGACGFAVRVLCVYICLFSRFTFGYLITTTN